MKTKIKTESPLSVKDQIDVLEAAKVVLVSSLISIPCRGLCRAINIVIREDYNHLAKITAHDGIYKVIPSFTFENAVLSGTVDNDADPHWFWWDPSVEKGGITNRLAFLNWLIEQLKEAIA